MIIDLRCNATAVTGRTILAGSPPTRISVKHQYGERDPGFLWGEEKINKHEVFYGQNEKKNSFYCGESEKFQPKNKLRDWKKK